MDNEITPSSVFVKKQNSVKGIKSKNFGWQVNLLNEKKVDIIPLSDIFAGYVFEKPENWSYLSWMVNLLLEEYQQQSKTKVTLIPTKDFRVSTHFKTLLADMTGKVRPREQDIKITGKKTLHFIELQRKSNPKVAIGERALEYFTFQLKNQTSGAMIQIWLFEGNNKKLMRGKTYTHYALIDVADSTPYPGVDAGIICIDLKQISKTDTEAGDVSKILLGVEPSNNSDKVKKFRDMLQEEFNKFKSMEEVVSVLSRLDEERLEGEIRGEIRGKVLALHQIVKMLPQEIAYSLKISEDMVLDIISSTE